MEAFLAWHRERGDAAEMSGDDAEVLPGIMDKIRAAREEEAPLAPVYEMDTEERRGGFWRYGWAAAVVVVLAGAVLLWRSGKRQPESVTVAMVYKTLVAKPGQSVHLLLSDSSEVWLSAGSTLRYPQPFSDSLRNVELVDGEAFFQVHADPNRRFEVRTDRLLTKVLGTSFDVKAYKGSQQTSVSVVTGKVGVGLGRLGQDMLLTADQQARYNAGSDRLVRKAVGEGHSAYWKRDSFAFEEELLGDIAIELEHYYNVKIYFKYPGLRKYAVTASFSHQTSVRDILTTLCQLNQNHVTQTDAQHYVIH